VIPYGDRWPGGAPPKDAYSVVHNPGRFAPLADVAEAVIEYLRRIDGVTANDNLRLTEERELRFLGPGNASGPHIQRAVRLTPPRPEAAPLTLAFTNFPGIGLWAGAFFRLFLPRCGCDACDEEWSGCANELEMTVFAVVNGTFSELLRGRRLETRISYPGGGSSSVCSLRYLPYSPFDVKTAARRLRSLSDNWQPW